MACILLGFIQHPCWVPPIADMLRRDVLSVLLALLLSCANAFINPILPGYNPDPTFLAVPGGGYFISTSTFEFFPGHPIYHSKDLVQWTLIGHGLNTPSQLQLYGVAPEGGIWAPTLRYYDDTYFLFTTNRRVYTTELRQMSRVYFVTTKDIFSNRWSEPRYLDVEGYDADIFIENGTVWVTRSDINNPLDKIYGIYQTQVDLTTGRSLTADRLIFNGTLSLNSSSRPEGPHLYKKDGTYYLLIAEGGSSVYHRATIQRGPSPSGPWEDNPANPLVYNGVDPDPTTQPVQWTGHADIIQTASGEWYGVCLGIRPQGGNIARAQLGRETFLFPVQWKDGWPVFNDGKSIGLVGPGLRNRTFESTSWYDDFSAEGQSQLGLSYYFLRTPYAPFYSFVARPGYLRIYGSPTALGDRDTPALVLRKQDALSQLFSTTVEFAPAGTREEAGLTAFYSDWYHQDIFLSRCPGSPANSSTCVVWRTAVSNNVTTAPVTNATSMGLQHFPVPPGPVQLAIRASPTRYDFGYAARGEEMQWVGSVDSIWLFSAPPGEFLFKGVQLGMYVTGNARTLAGNYADFAHWNQTTYAPDPVE